MDYVTAVRSFGRPTEEQFAAFAHHLSNAHSWYKHLPVDGPGEAFFVYPSPNTHTAWIDTAAGRTEPRPFIKERENNARAMMVIQIEYQPGDIEPDHLAPLDYVTGGIDTATYRQRFGIMTYWNHSHPGQPASEALEDASTRIRWRTDNASSVSVPPDVLEAGLVYLNASVSPMFDGSSTRTRREQLEALIDASGLSVSLWVEP